MSQDWMPGIAVPRNLRSEQAFQTAKFRRVIARARRPRLLHSVSRQQLEGLFVEVITLCRPHQLFGGDVVACLPVFLSLQRVSNPFDMRVGRKPVHDTLMSMTQAPDGIEGKNIQIDAILLREAQGSDRRNRRRLLRWIKVVAASQERQHARQHREPFHRAVLGPGMNAASVIPGPTTTCRPLIARLSPPPHPSLRTTRFQAALRPARDCPTPQRCRRSGRFRLRRYRCDRVLQKR